MNINKYIPSIHNWYVEQGEYKCKSCNGSGTRIPGADNSISQALLDCQKCNGTGQHKNIGEILAEIAGLLVGDALRAKRKNLVANWHEWSNMITENMQNIYFSEKIKDSFEDYIAQAFIKLFDTAGYLGIEIYYSSKAIYSLDSDNVIEKIYMIVKALPDLWEFKTKEKDYESSIETVYIALLNLCKYLNIPIEKHIDARLQYMGIDQRCPLEEVKE